MSRLLPLLAILCFSGTNSFADPNAENSAGIFQPNNFRDVDTNGGSLGAMLEKQQSVIEKREDLDPKASENLGETILRTQKEKTSQESLKRIFAHLRSLLLEEKVDYDLGLQREENGGRATYKEPAQELRDSPLGEIFAKDEGDNGKSKQRLAEFEEVLNEVSTLRVPLSNKPSPSSHQKSSDIPSAVIIMQKAKLKSRLDGLTEIQEEIAGLDNSKNKELLRNQAAAMNGILQAQLEIYEVELGKREKEDKLRIELVKAKIKEVQTEKLEAQNKKPNWIRALAACFRNKGSD